MQNIKMRLKSKVSNVTEIQISDEQYLSGIFVILDFPRVNYILKRVHSSEQSILLALKVNT